MKRFVTALTGIIILTSFILPSTAYAVQRREAPVETPVLTHVSFKNASLAEDFSEYINEYNLILDDASVTPTLESYKISGSAQVFAQYIYNDAKRQTGMTITLEFESGTNVYTFNYANLLSYAPSNNNMLSQLSCDLGEVYPEINDKDTDYKLYVPCDLTELRISATTQDTGAYCDIPASISLNSEQEPVITTSVIASNGEARIYTFRIKRLDKTCEEVMQIIADPDAKSIVRGELFYHKPVFFIAISSVFAGIILLVAFVKIAKRVTVKVGDDEETEFFEI